LLATWKPPVTKSPDPVGIGLLQVISKKLSP